LERKKAASPTRASPPARAARAHVGGFPELEEEMTTYVPDPGVESPNRMDALVWALTELMLKPGGARIVSAASPAAARIPGVTERATVVELRRPVAGYIPGCV
jgi:hypothetical protein